LVDVIFRQEDAAAEMLVGRACVVIDVLRMATTAATALMNGARGVRCFATPEQATRAADDLGREHVLLGGERAGVRIAGFDLGNSPGEYTPDLCRGKTLVMTTTNGTRALGIARDAAEVLFAAFCSAGAVVRHVAARPGPTVCLCCGTEGEVGGDDVACAGLIVHRLAAARGSEFRFTDSARIARGFYLHHAGDLESLLMQSAGGAPLRRIGLASDVAGCALIDSVSLVPWLDRESATIVPVCAQTASFAGGAPQIPPCKSVGAAGGPGRRLH